MLTSSESSSYESYKVTGISWLQSIPVSWELKRFKFLISEVNERSENGEDCLLSVSQYTGVTRKSDKINDGDLLTNAESLEGYKRVKKGDLVSNIMLAWNGSLGVSPFDGITSPAYGIYRFGSECIDRFYHYLLRTELYKAEFKRRSTGVIESRLRLYTDDFFDIVGIVPPINEQTLIANFLDKKTAQIDEAIAIKEQQISLLKERKQIIIQQAVTQGLDPNMPMKDSGVDWIGKIPEHWNVMRLKMGTRKITDGAHISPDLSEEKHPFVSTVNVDEHGNIDLKNCIYTSQSCYKYLVKTGCSPIKGDILFSKDGTVGRTAIVDFEDSFVIASSLVIVRAKKEVFDLEYLNFLLRSEHIKQQTDAVLSGSALRRISLLKISNLLLFRIPIDEQIKINKYCYGIELEVKEAVDIQNKQIEKLKEYKTTLINSAVTGKIKITPEMIDE
ncbi:restriction endonuclease subunit S [Marinomonas ostreistagni]|uniref:restriction endonuclease subunit S n=1 Tax=Marinomonas ostreistagni TaxID=359209 RepID=UPI00194EF03F|nr:restriction endonuclease subunit S [Marinomonas ostreistagni]MBM6549794.1 restriction endonuclease subunit S [Marinomonas ostreistagni]